jgi:hypothetical protein
MIARSNPWSGGIAAEAVVLAADIEARLTRIENETKRRNEAAKAARIFRGESIEEPSQ